MPHRWTQVVLRRSALVVGVWIILAVVAKSFAPAWNDVALDGDFDYLPAERVSVAGGRLLDEAFEGTRSRSQMVIVFSRESPWTLTDELVSLDILRRLYHRLAEVTWQRAEQDGFAQREQSLQTTREALSESLEIDTRFYKLLDDRVPEKEATLIEPRLAIGYWDRGQYRRQYGLEEQPSREPENNAADSTSENELKSENDKQQLAQQRTTAAITNDLESAVVLQPNIATSVQPITERPLQAWDPLLDVYSWQDSVIGGQLKRPQARLAVLSLSSELTATGNIALLQDLQAMVDRCRDYQQEYLHDDEKGLAKDLRIEITGSAAVGGQTLLAARTAIAYTEYFTIGMILLILIVVYRAPILVLVPLISIAIAVMLSTGLVTTLASLSTQTAMLDLKVYTTSRIFVIVILFGAGTDYCLFLISRLREETRSHEWSQACQVALWNTSGALLGSALTTVFGLSMLWFADFGKFHHTGPVIAICLAVGLLVCMTFTPALLRLIGPKIFWPARLTNSSPESAVTLLSNRDLSSRSERWTNLFWNATAIALTRYPILTLMAGLLTLGLPAWYGWRHEQSVTYDLSGQLDRRASSRQGMRTLDRNFGAGQLAPISILAVAPHDLPEPDRKSALSRLRKRLYQIDGVLRVRTVNDPLGDFRPDQGMGLLSSDAWRRRALRNHRLARSHFIASEPKYRERLLRVDVVIEEDPFSHAANECFQRIDLAIQKILPPVVESSDTKVVNQDWDVFYAGTIPSIVDLRAVTLADTQRIKIAVVLAVLLVLIVVLRRLALSSYLILTVLLSYYATVGITYFLFRFIDGDEFLGLDWKLPLFLFVILVAIGQDYNVYLVTRIIEERRKLGSLAAIRRAVARTGGIVTACGFVMAATFFSMTSSAWWPEFTRIVAAALPIHSESIAIVHASGVGASSQNTLRGITELGFALGLGVLIDTLYVRTVLVPSFVVLHDRYRRRKTAGV